MLCGNPQSLQNTSRTERTERQEGRSSGSRSRTPFGKILRFHPPVNLSHSIALMARPDSSFNLLKIPVKLRRKHLNQTEQRPPAAHHHHRVL